MMNSAKEQELAAQLRLIARQYCDGAFNKIEYRRQRREILQQCVQQDLNAAAQPSDELVEGDSASGSKRSDLKARPATQVDWMPYLMLGVTLVVLGVMGFLLFSMM